MFKECEVLDVSLRLLFFEDFSEVLPQSSFVQRFVLGVFVLVLQLGHFHCSLTNIKNHNKNGRMRRKERTII
jgi:hypothetical protein